MASQLAPIVHSVFFYDTDEALMQRGIGVAMSALNGGNAVLMVVGAHHADQLAQYLSPRAFRNVHAMTRLTVVDADALLKKCIRDGMPDRDCFLQAISALVNEASIPTDRTGGKLTIFSGMVAALWARGQHQAALEMERLWNEALASGNFYLHCAYPKKEFAFAPDQTAITSICEQHSHSFGALEDAV